MHSDPGSKNIGEAERPGVIDTADGDTTAVIHQIHCAESGLVFAPVCPCANGNLILKQHAGFGETTALPRPRATFSLESIHRGWTNRQQFLLALGTDLKNTGFVQPW